MKKIISLVFCFALLAFVAQLSILADILPRLDISESTENLTSSQQDSSTNEQTQTSLSDENAGASLQSGGASMLTANGTTASTGVSINIDAVNVFDTKSPCRETAPR